MRITDRRSGSLSEWIDTLLQEAAHTSLHQPFAKKQYPLFPVEIKHFLRGWHFTDYRKDSRESNS